MILARADAWPEVARDAGFQSSAFDAYAVVVKPSRLYLLGRSEAAVQHAVADVLPSLGISLLCPIAALARHPTRRAIGRRPNASRRSGYADVAKSGTPTAITDRD